MLLYDSNNYASSTAASNDTEAPSSSSTFHGNGNNVAPTRSRSPSRTSTITNNSQTQPFTVNSFTQNLSSVLSDPTRSKSETAAFFVRHWGEQFVPSTNFPLPSTVPKITVEHFRQYLLTTAKKHRQYVRARKALRRALARHYEETTATREELPDVFLDPLFALHNPRYFNVVFLEPLPGEDDQLISAAEKRRLEERRLKGKADDDATLSRAESNASLTSTFSLQAQLPADVSSGRPFRSYQQLHNRLEHYHDMVGALLNKELESKSEEFWKTVNSYSDLQNEVEGALTKVVEIRSGLKSANENIVKKMQRVLEIHQERENKALLLQRLQDIACLRDAQATVQMLLNQNDFPKALECIETAQEVLNSDLKGVVCFRHLSLQLDELYKVIGRMLQDEFVALIQKEFGKPLEKDSDVVYQEAQLHPVTHGLLRCGEFRFLQVLRHEIVEAIKNTIRQIIKNRIVEYGAELSEFDPSLGNLGDQMRRLTFDQWMATLEAVFASLLLLCRRIMSIQELMLENVDRVMLFEMQRARNAEEDAEGSDIGLSLNAEPHLIGSHSTADFQHPSITSLANDIHRSASDATLVSRKESVVSTVASEDASGAPMQPPPTAFASSAATMLSIPCRDVSQVRSILPCLLEHTVFAAQERVSRLLVTKSKDGFLETCTPSMFRQVEDCVRRYVAASEQLLQDQYATGPFASKEDSFPSDGQPTVRVTSPALASQNRSPLHLTMQQQASRLIVRFHETRKQKLTTLLDSEQWKIAEVPAIFQQIVDDLCEFDRLTDPIGLSVAEDVVEENQPQATCLVVDGEPFYVIGTALLLLRMLAQYCDLVRMFPECSVEVLQHVIEVCKLFNSRTCQLILGAGALQLVGLKSISVKHLSLAARCIQLVARLIPVVRRDFEDSLPADKHQFLRHFDRTLCDFQNHVDEIYSKLVGVVDFHLLSCLSGWQVTGDTPTPAFQHVIKQIGKFYNGFSSVMPSKETTKILLRVHASFKSHFRNFLEQRRVSPHDSLTYGLASADYDYYIENMRALPDCEEFPHETLHDVFA